MGKWIQLPIIAAGLYFAWSLYAGREVRHPAGVIVSAQPSETEHAPAPLPPVGEWQLTAVADYEIQGRVLGLKRYRSGTGKLAPYDLGLGWGELSDTASIGALNFSQSNRFLFYRWYGSPPLAENIIRSHCSNNHLIPASDAIRSQIAALRRGHIVRLSGQLVNITGPGGFTWNTSRQRDDTGNGACEVIYVTALRFSERSL